jgi:hypothetical protein
VKCRLGSPAEVDDVKVCAACRRLLPARFGSGSSVGMVVQTTLSFGKTQYLGRNWKQCWLISWCIFWRPGRSATALVWAIDMSRR